jgi:hypothetical protein
LNKEETVSKKEIFATTQINTLYRKIILANLFCLIAIRILVSVFNLLIISILKRERPKTKDKLEYIALFL